MISNCFINKNFEDLYPTYDFVTIKLKVVKIMASADYFCDIIYERAQNVIEISKRFTNTYVRSLEVIGKKFLKSPI